MFLIYKMVSKFPKFKSTKPSLPKFSAPVKYFIITVLVVLIAFTVVYLYNIHKMSKKMELFSDVVGAEAMSTKSEGAPEVVFLHMTGCGHCVKFAPTWDKVAASKDWDNKVKFSKFEKSDEGAKPFLDKIDGFPTVLFVVNGEVVDMSVGNSDEASLTTFINKNMA